VNGYKCVIFLNEEGKNEIYLLLSSFKRKDKSCFYGDEILIPCPIISRFPQIPAWGVEINMPSKKKSSKKKSSHRKNRSKKTKKVIS
jgi:hypothetical protein